MGRSDTATVTVGIKIQLSTLIEQINDDNLVSIQNMLENGFIDDENGEMNTGLRDLVYGIKKSCNAQGKDAAHYKNILKEDFDIGSRSNGPLWNEHILIPEDRLLHTTRWGYQREGYNGTSRNMDFDMRSIEARINDKYKNIITGYTVALILLQSGG